jgi:hypothetical protein
MTDNVTICEPCMYPDTCLHFNRCVFYAGLARSQAVTEELMQASTVDVSEALRDALAEAKIPPKV